MMDGKIRIRMISDARRPRVPRGTRRQRSGVAQTASTLSDRAAPILRGWGSAGVGGADKRANIANLATSAVASPASPGEVLQEKMERAVPVRRSLRRKYFVRNALLDVVGFSRKYQQRLVLCLPSESRNRSIIAARVKTSANSQESFLSSIRRQVRSQYAVWSRLHQPQSKYGRGDPEDYIVAAQLLRELGLSHAVVQPAASLRPVTLDESWTPPSGTDPCCVTVIMKRASRTGPSGVMKGGTLLAAPWSVASATCRSALDSVDSSIPGCCLRGRLCVALRATVA